MIKYLRKSNYKKGAVDYNNFLNNLLNHSDMVDISNSNIVLYRDNIRQKIWLVKHPGEISMENSDLVNLIKDHGGDPEEVIKEYKKMSSPIV